MYVTKHKLHIMKDLTGPFHSFHQMKSAILLIAKEKLDRQAFCMLHKMQESRLSRIMNEKTNCDDLTFDYICQALGFRLVLFYDET